jgi:hypothetical protein
MNFGDLIKKAREDAGMTHQQAADALLVCFCMPQDAPTVHAWAEEIERVEVGYAAFDISAIEHLAKIYGLSAVPDAWYQALSVIPPDVVLGLRNHPEAWPDARTLLRLEGKDTVVWCGDLPADTHVHRVLGTRWSRVPDDGWAGAVRGHYVRVRLEGLNAWTLRFGFGEGVEVSEGDFATAAAAMLHAVRVMRFWLARAELAHAAIDRDHARMDAVAKRLRRAARWLRYGQGASDES